MDSSIQNSSVDKLPNSLRIYFPKVCKAAEYENAIFSLAKELERTQKLINALEFVIIPQYEGCYNFYTCIPRGTRA